MRNDTLHSATPATGETVAHTKREKSLQEAYAWQQITGCVRVLTCMLRHRHIHGGMHFRGGTAISSAFLGTRDPDLKPLDLSGSCHRRKAATIIFGGHASQLLPA